MSPPNTSGPSGSSQALLLLLGGLAGLGAAELTLRGLGTGLPHLGIFSEEGGQLRLLPDASAQVRRADGEGYTVETDQRGWRRGPRSAGCSWLVVGDSQAMGSGVEAEYSFGGRLGACVAAVPGHGIVDALAAVPTPAPEGVLGVVLVANQANDWDEGLVPALDRYAVRGGWLVTRSRADSWTAAVWGSRLSRSHVAHLLGSLLLGGLFAPDAAVPLWTDPGATNPVSVAIAGAIHSFAVSRPELRVVVAWLPVDVAMVARDDSPFTEAAREARAPVLGDPRIRDQLFGALTTRELPPGVGPVDRVDLGEVLAGQADAFLRYDYHMSERGHELVATRLAAALGLSPKEP